MRCMRCGFHILSMPTAGDPLPQDKLAGFVAKVLLGGPIIVELLAGNNWEHTKMSGVAGCMIQLVLIYHLSIDTHTMFMGMFACPCLLATCPTANMTLLFGLRQIAEINTKIKHQMSGFPPNNHGSEG